MRHRPSVFKCVLLTTGSFSNISSIHVTVLCSLFMSSVFAQPPFLSILSGIIAVVIYHFCGPKMAPSKEHAANKTAVTAQTKSYLMVFLVVAVLVYGSFVIAESGGGVKYATPQAEIQTGGRPPF